VGWRPWCACTLLLSRIDVVFCCWMRRSALLVRAQALSKVCYMFILGFPAMHNNMAQGGMADEQSKL